LGSSTFITGEIHFDEQGLIAYLLTEQDYRLIPLEDIAIAHPDIGYVQGNMARIL